jgi:cell division septum initiation protein DivIVA
MDRLDRKDLKDAAFDVVLRGYDKRQVDERLRFLGAELIAADNALRAAGQRTVMLEDALNEARSVPDGEPSGNSSFGARVEKILTLAQDEAREVRSQADTAATALLDQARAKAAEQDSTLQRRFAELERAGQEVDQARQEVNREAERVRAQSRAEADQIRAAVTHDADQLFTAARADAAEVGKVARAEAEQFIAQAHAEAEQLVAQASAQAQRLVASATDAARQREQSSAHEVHQLSRLREEINADLYRAKEVLDGLFGATGVLLQKRRQDPALPPPQVRTV